MKLKILFNGFRHGHIDTLYKKVSESDIASVAGCIENDEGARLNAEKTLGAVFSDVSYDEWLKTDIDAVAVGNAYGDRGKVIIKALKAGKHVIADKPICTTLDELEEIHRLSNEKNLKIACMLDLRYLPQSLKAKEILDSGSMGKIRNVSFNGQHCIDYAHRPLWYFEEGMHGGTVNDLAIHGIDLVRMMTGCEFVKTDGVRVWNSYAVKHPHFKDSAMFMARLDSGAEVMADISYSAPSQVFSMPVYWQFMFWCDNGLLMFNYADNKVIVYKEGTTEAEITECTAGPYDYLTEFVGQIDSNSRKMTENVIASSRTALLIQKEAEQNG